MEAGKWCDGYLWRNDWKTASLKKYKKRNRKPQKTDVQTITWDWGEHESVEERTWLKVDETKHSVNIALFTDHTGAAQDRTQ